MRQINKMTDPGLIRDLYIEDPDTYEQCLLIALYKDDDFRAEAMPHLIWQREGHREVNLFTIPTNQVLAYAIRGWRDKHPHAEMSESVLHTFLSIMVRQDRPIIYEEQIVDIVDKFQDMMSAMDADNALYIVKDTWCDWALRRGFDITNREFERTGNTDTDARILALMDMRNSINTASIDKSTRVSVMEAFADEDDEVERIPLSGALGAINTCLGGGFGRGEHTLFVAPSGGGKTVMACQIASDLASLGRHVLLITTEQPPKQLLPRMVSCASRTNLKPPLLASDIKDGLKNAINKKKMTEAQQAFTDTFLKSINNTLHFEDWSKPGKALCSDLKSTVEGWQRDLAKQGEKLDVVILDWIGGRLGDDATSPEKRRIIYDTAANLMKDIAIELDVSAISFAQATPVANRKLLITQDDIAECKSMHMQATAAFGMSAVRVPESKAGSDVYEENQKLCCFKSRKGITAIANLKRDFKYQRFECKSLSTK